MRNLQEDNSIRGGDGTTCNLINGGILARMTVIAFKANRRFHYVRGKGIHCVSSLPIGSFSTTRKRPALDKFSLARSTNGTLSVAQAPFSIYNGSIWGPIIQNAKIVRSRSGFGRSVGKSYSKPLTRTFKEIYGILNQTTLDVLLLSHFTPSTNRALFVFRNC